MRPNRTLFLRCIGSQSGHGMFFQSDIRPIVLYNVYGSTTNSEGQQFSDRD